MEPKYPNVSVQLSGEDGNAFAVLSRVKTAMRKAKGSQQDQEAFMKEAMSGDYDALLRTCMKYVSVS